MRPAVRAAGLLGRWWGRSMAVYVGMAVLFVALLPVGIAMNRGKRK